MTLSAMATSQIADALKEDVISHIYSNERYAEVMTDLISEALLEKLGEMDEQLFFDLGMILMDRIELK
tara:strand:- start:185 stop:388 length:204 start_codon:yes stop_codon:yes gene_type:complete